MRRRRTVHVKPPPAVEVAVADKSPVVQTGLRVHIEGDARLRLVVMASDGERFMHALERFRFEVAVVGWAMPYMDGRAVLEALRDRPRSPRVIVYTGVVDPSVPAEAMRLGAAGFCGKHEAPGRLLDMIAAVAGGHMMFPFVDPRATAPDPLAGLSPRERELLAALGSGRTNAGLARLLGVSENTVKFHLRNLFDKLGVRSRAQAVDLFHHAGPARPEVPPPERVG